MLRILCCAAALLWTAAASGQSATGIDTALLTNSNAVVRNTTLQFVYNSPTSANERCLDVVTILNRNGTDYGNFMCSTDKTTVLKSFSGELLDSSGKVIRKFKRSDLKYTEYSGSSLATDNGLYYLNAYAPVYPYTVKYEYEIEHKNGILSFSGLSPIPGLEASLEKGEYTLSVPAGLRLKYKNINTSIEPERTTVNGRDIYRWRVEGIPAIKSERWSPPLLDLLPIVLAAPGEFTYDGTTGSLSDWEGLGRWQCSLLEGRNVLPEALKAEVHRRTDALATPREKIKALYDYLGESTRYVSIQLGIGGWQPMSTEEVYKTKFGDCKALTNYLRAMLSECGIESCYTIINTHSRQMYRDFPSFTQANHVVLGVPLEKDTLWLECTNPEVPFGYVHDLIAGHNAVVIHNGTGRFITLPQYADTLNRLVQHVDLTLAADGSATGRITERYEVGQYEDMMSFVKKEPKKQIDYLLTDLRKIPLIRLDSVVCREEKTALPSIEIAYTFNAPKYGNVSGSRCFIPQSPFSSATTMDKGKRFCDIDCPAGYSDQIIITLHIPTDMRIEAMPKPVRMETPFGSFSSEITYEEGLITIDQRTTIRTGRYSREAYDDFRKFIDQRASTFNASLVLRKQQ